MRVVGRSSEVDLEILHQLSIRVQNENERMVKFQEVANPAKANGNQNNLKVTNEELQKIIQEIKRKLDFLNRYLKIEIDDQLEIPVVKIFERDTNRLIRQVPPDHILRLMRRIDEMLGVFLSERV